jgi:arginine decarboxylase
MCSGAMAVEWLTRPVLDYLRSGVQAGMVIPDAADTTLGSVRVMTE